MRHAYLNPVPTWQVTKPIKADTEARPGSPTWFAKTIAAHLGELFGFAPETVTARRTDLNADGVPKLAEIEIFMNGHRAIVAITPNDTDPRMHDYALTVDDAPVRHATTVMRPTAHLIAEAIHRAITTARVPGPTNA